MGMKVIVLSEIRQTPYTITVLKTRSQLHIRIEWSNYDKLETKKEVTNKLTTEHQIPERKNFAFP